ncbi:MAG: cation:proton antiporter [Deltaproteobacteria bacterium]|nr:cation:proton antiporter [Deltaproteobacteria bacterium]
MTQTNPLKKTLITNFLFLLFLTLFAAGINYLNKEGNFGQTGYESFALGFVMLAAYSAAKLLKTIGLPIISGYIFSGIIAGPYITGFLNLEMVHKFSLIDDLALSFIGMTAGGALKIESLKKRSRAIFLNTLLQSIMVFLFVYSFIIFTGHYFQFIRNLTHPQIIAFAVLLGVIAIARSPSSAIAIINECRASGPFTDTILGVTIVMDVFIIIFFTIAMTAVQIILAESGVVDYLSFSILFCAIAISFIIGALLGKLISFYIKSFGHDLALLLLFVSFTVSKICMAVNPLIETHFNIDFHLEPLLICMSAGFTVQNFSREGKLFLGTLDRISLPIYLLFFTLAGAALDIKALRMCWPLALCIAMVRVFGIFAATWLSGSLTKDPVKHKKNAWMAYITQAGVAIGLAQIAARQSMEIGVYLSTIVLAVITINQIIGPITFKIALGLTGEAQKK